MEAYIMARFLITASYEYSAEIEARTEAEAESLFLDDLNSHYVGTDSFEIEELEEEEED
jgi:hypothetical protein